MADQAKVSHESPESRLLGAGFGRRLELWISPDGQQVLNTVDAIAALDSGEIQTDRLEIPALPDQPGFRELTPEFIDAMADRLFRPPPPPQPDWLEPLAELVVEKLKPVIRAEVRAVRANAAKRAREAKA